MNPSVLPLADEAASSDLAPCATIQFKTKQAKTKVAEVVKKRNDGPKMKALPAVASPDHVPLIAVSAFAGVRHAEVRRLDWLIVDRKAGIIEIRAGTAKTANRRVIPITPNLAKWLKESKRESGKGTGIVQVV
jgi:integrase